MIKCSTGLAFYHFSPSRLINSIKHEHSCKILYFIYLLQLARLVDRENGASQYVHHIVQNDVNGTVVNVMAVSLVSMVTSVT